MTDTRAISGRRRRYSAIHAGALAVAIASGTFALVAMLVGSPTSFGLALALCGAGWIDHSADAAGLAFDALQPLEVFVFIGDVAVVGGAC